MFSYFGNFNEIYSKNDQSHYFKTLSKDERVHPKSSVFEEKKVGGKKGSDQGLSDGKYKKQNGTKVFVDHTFSREHSLDKDLVKTKHHPNFMSETFKSKNQGNKGSTDGEYKKENRTKMFEDPSTFSRDHSHDKDLVKQNHHPDFMSNNFKSKNRESEGSGKDIGDGEYKKQKGRHHFEDFTFSRDQSLGKDLSKKAIPANFRKVKKNKVDHGENQSLLKHFVSQTFKRQNRDIHKAGKQGRENADGKPVNIKNLEEKKKYSDNFDPKSERPKSSVEKNKMGKSKPSEFKDKKNSTIPRCKGDECPESQIILETPQIIINFFGSSKSTNDPSTPQPRTTKQPKIVPGDIFRSSSYIQDVLDSKESYESEVSIEKKKNKCYDDKSKKFVPCDGKSFYLNHSQDYYQVKSSEDQDSQDKESKEDGVSDVSMEKKKQLNKCYDDKYKKFVPCDGKSIYLSQDYDNKEVGNLSKEKKTGLNKCYDDQSKKFVPCDGKSIYLQ